MSGVWGSHLRRAVAASGSAEGTSGTSGGHLRWLNLLPWDSRPCPSWLGLCSHRDAGWLLRQQACVGSQVPSTLASSHQKPARHSGGRFSRAKRTINSLRAGLPAKRVTQEVTDSCPRSPGWRGLGPVSSSVPGATHLDYKESESTPSSLGTAPVLGVGTLRGL